jgi:hypothetical protein
VLWPDSVACRPVRYRQAYVSFLVAGDVWCITAMQNLLLLQEQHSTFSRVLRLHRLCATCRLPWWCSGKAGARVRKVNWTSNLEFKFKSERVRAPNLPSLQRSSKESSGLPFTPRGECVRSAWVGSAAPSHSIPKQLPVTVCSTAITSARGICACAHAHTLRRLLDNGSITIDSC